MLPDNSMLFNWTIGLYFILYIYYNSYFLTEIISTWQWWRYLIGWIITYRLLDTHAAHKSGIEYIPSIIGHEMV